ncbi:Lipopolysaccharide biosynthesis protein, LPS:glycosyltransferase [Anaerovibrio lipolyticus DSM 3074]|uniref:Lipopolysaccharide biosynthesis protein, LPS:glycosyltransferase n=1 Tax=Anaerovibrio lipolyticus DSM 3074 TaxID=1120997 RepID=A0A1M6G363_9FIRM|nr:glycosyltransferase family 8 protein [Anaerovibrio lipolyticus]SHJ04396.1 Lipopolysaccharide biosynthesis protein, LPS:glycosyltransferase [Anaerovibrio lipolyticus DSM 3074]
MSTTIHVCYSLNDISGKYTKFIGASLCSLWENTPYHVTAHILHDDTLTDENRNHLVNLAQYYGQEIFFYNVLHYSAMVDFIAKMNRIYMSRYQGMFYRLGAGIILPSHVEKIIYLDADVIVHMDIAKLWDIRLDNASIAAVPDSIVGMLPPERAPLLVKTGIVAQDKYFNSGVLVMNMNYFREHPQLADEMVDFLLEHENWREYPDQDFLNYSFRNSCKYLPIEFNYLVSYARWHNLFREKAIFHYAGSVFGFDLSDCFSNLFWHYLYKTPWQNEVAVTQSLSELGKLCRETVEKAAVLRLLLERTERIFFGSPALYSELGPSFKGMFYDSGEDINSSLSCGDMLDVFDTIPVDERVIVVVSRHYEALKNWFSGMGLKEGSDFVNGYVLTLPEQKIAYFSDSAIIGRC